MNQTAQREVHRLAIQTELDAGKSKQDRNRLGQFATPTALAQEVVAYGVQLLPHDAPVRFLDPAFGTGAFYSALLHIVPVKQIKSATGFEIDEHYGIPAKKFWKERSLDLKLADFTHAHPPREKANLLICNPPYVRHHHVAGSDKLRLQARCFQASGMQLSGLAGLYCYFLGLSHEWMADGGIAGWLIPSEFMDVNYGKAVKEYLLREVTLLRIHRFDPGDVQFDDALVSSAVVWFKKSPPPPGHRVAFTFGGTHASPAKSKGVALDVLRSEPKWTRFPLQDTRSGATVTTLGDLFDIKRGIATGGNDYFILTAERIAELELPREFCRPILPSPRYLDGDEIFADTDGNPILTKSLFLLDCRLPEEKVKARYPRLWAYYERGRDEMGTRYLCKTRSPWYAQENRLPSPFLCTYMGRGRKGAHQPFRFILNHSSAIVANSYLVLYPKPHVTEQLRRDPALARKLWQALNSISTDTLTDEGRVYGGGLHKMEPRELANVPAERLLKIIEAPIQCDMFALHA